MEKESRNGQEDKLPADYFQMWRKSINIAVDFEGVHYIIGYGKKDYDFRD